MKIAYLQKLGYNSRTCASFVEEMPQARGKQRRTGVNGGGKSVLSCHTGRKA